jgi:ribose 5-phosphate isomerase B
MKIVIGNDHAGFPMKAEALDILKKLGVEIIDAGCHSADPVDFPDIALEVCRILLSGKADRAIMLCGTGVGAVMAANKYRGIRAGLCNDIYCAHQGVEHDDMNVLCMGGKLIGAWLMKEIISAFVNAHFDNTPDVRQRVAKLNMMGSELPLEK